MRKFLIFSVGPIIVLCFVSLAFAPDGSIPHLINYQGMVTDDVGNPLTTPQDLSFRIYDAEFGGTSLWDETHNSVPVSNGLFNVILGSINPVNLRFDEDYWLEIEVGASDTLSPRFRLTSVPYAYRAETAESDGDWIISGNDIYSTVSGNVGIGAASPSQKLDVAGYVKGQSGLCIGNDCRSVWPEGYWIQSGSNLYPDNNNWNVGIGTAFPAYKLDVDGDIRVGGADIRDAGGTQRITLTDDGRLDLKEDGGATSLSIATNGNVGIGTTSPGQKLQVAGTIYSKAGGFKFPDGSVQTTAGALALPYKDSTSAIGHYAFSLTNNTGFGMEIEAKGGGEACLAIRADNNGNADKNVGVSAEATNNLAIGVFGRGANALEDTNYGGYFEAWGSSGRGVYGYASGDRGWGVYGEAPSGTFGCGVVAYGGQYDFYARGPGSNYGPFTGAHEVKLSQDVPENVKTGMIVSVTGETSVRRQRDGTVSISSTLPTVSLSHRARDKAVFGVLVKVSGVPPDHWSQPKAGERFATVNALGEGRVWVSNINAEIEVGDYITTSSTPGYGQKQDDDLLHSYTLGKAIESVDWNSVSSTIEFDGQIFKVYLIAVVYTSG